MGAGRKWRMWKLMQARRGAVSAPLHLRARVRLPWGEIALTVGENVVLDTDGRRCVVGPDGILLPIVEEDSDVNQ